MFARKRNPSKANYDNEAFDGFLSQAWIPLRLLYALILIQLFLDENVNIGIVIFLMNQMIECGADWVSLSIIFVQSQIQTIPSHFATRLIHMNAGNTATANLVIEQKVEVSVCDGIQIIITSNTARVAYFSFCWHKPKVTITVAKVYFSVLVIL